MRQKRLRTTGSGYKLWKIFYNLAC